VAEGAAEHDAALTPARTKTKEVKSVLRIVGARTQEARRAWRTTDRSKFMG
jgi:hypothetical protein